MTRFREEYYETRAHKAWVKARRGIGPQRDIQAEWQALRAQYFQKPRAVRERINKAQARFQW